MADFSGYTDAALNTLIAAMPSDWYKRSSHVPDQDEFYKELVKEVCKRVMQNKENVDTEVEGIQITPGTGTGFTLVKAGAEGHRLYKCTLTFAGLSAVALTADKTIATLPAKTKIIGMIADTTVPYTGGDVSAATLQVGIASGDLDAFLVDHDVLSGAVVAGVLDAELGDLINALNAVSGGYIDWAATTVISVRLTAVGANTEELTAGSTTYYIETVKYP
jgi:hypothetical protein